MAELLSSSLVCHLFPASCVIENALKYSEVCCLFLPVSTVSAAVVKVLDAIRIRILTPFLYYASRLSFLNLIVLLLSRLEHIVQMRRKAVTGPVRGGKRVDLFVLVHYTV
jgi:hypothetical protein